MYIYIDNKRPNAGLSLEGPTTLDHHFVDNKKNHQGSKARSTCSFWSSKTLLSGLETKKDKLKTRDGLKRAPREAVWFKKRFSHFFYGAVQSLNIRCRKVVPKFCFENILATWILRFYWRGNLAEWIGVGEEELSNTGFMGLQATLGGYQEAGKRYFDQIHRISFDIREVQFQVERPTDILPDDAKKFFYTKVFAK